MNVALIGSGSWGTAVADPTTLRRTRAHTSTFAPRANPSRTVETRNARNENNVPLKPLSGVNGPSIDEDGAQREDHGDGKDWVRHNLAEEG